MQATPKHSQNTLASTRETEERNLKKLLETRVYQEDCIQFISLQKVRTNAKSISAEKKNTAAGDAHS